MITVEFGPDLAKLVRGRGAVTSRDSPRLHTCTHANCIHWPRQGTRSRRQRERPTAPSRTGISPHRARGSAWFSSGAGPRHRPREVGIGTATVISEKGAPVSMGGGRGEGRASKDHEPAQGRDEHSGQSHVGCRMQWLSPGCIGGRRCHVGRALEAFIAGVVGRHASPNGQGRPPAESGLLTSGRAS